MNSTREETIRTDSARETERLGECAGRAAQVGIPFCLWGELGAGKTVFVKGFARGLLGGDQPVASPTFVLQRVYRRGETRLYHIDAYRLVGGSEFEASGLSESLDDPGGVTCIEWAGRVGGRLPPERVEVEISHGEASNHRNVLLRPLGARAEAILDSALKFYARPADVSPEARA